MSDGNRFELPIGTTALRTVVIRHNLPDGSHHFDWMIARDETAKNPLITFRMNDRVDNLPDDDSSPAQRISDHRPEYLEYEGPVSGNRGHVQRARTGLVHHVTRHDAPGLQWMLDLLWNPEIPGDSPSAQQLVLEAQKDAVWLVFCVNK
jgi:hypothetical protein